MKNNKQALILFINALLVIIISIVILYFPFFQYEFLHPSYQIKKITDKDHSIVDFYDHSEKMSLEIAENALSQKYEFQDKKRSFAAIDRPLAEIFSSYEPYNNTQSFYIHSLSILFDLVRAHKCTGDEDYLKLGNRIIRKWYKVNPRKLFTENEYAWYDHSTAIRITAVLFFWDHFSKYSHDVELDRTIKMLTNDSIRYLRNPFRYSQHHNHGVFQDIALQYIALHLENDIEQKIIIEEVQQRAFDQFKFLISTDGISLENSPGYHYVITHLLNRFIQISPKKYKNNNLSNLLNLLNKNLAIFLKSDHTLTEIGDTDKNVRYDEYKSQEKGQLVSPESGFVVFKYEPYYYFLARSQSTIDNHKHDDSFSFIFDWSNESIVSECGFLSYENNADRKYSRSRKAHSTIFLPNESSLKSKSKFEGYINNDRLFYLRMIGSLNDNFIKRQFLYLKNYSILLILNENNVNLPFSQIFHLSEKINKIEKLSSQLIQVQTSLNQNIWISSESSKLELLYGNNKLAPSYKAIPYKKLKPAYSVLQNTRDKNLITAFSKDKQASIQISDNNILLEKAKDKFKIIIDDDTIQINEKDYLIHKIELSETIKKDIDKKYWPTHYYATRILMLIVFSILFYVLMALLLRKRLKNKTLFISYLIVPYFGLITLLLKILF